VQRATQKRLFEEIKSYYRANSTKLAESEIRHPASAYFDPNYLERERKLLWRHPQIVGHAGDLAKAGDFIAHDDGGVPILVSRQSDGSLKAFQNICSHRGSRVCTEPAGNRTNFTCPYHAWTFRNDGRLLAAPRDAFPNLDRASAGLVELAVEQRHGLIWVVMTPGLGIDVAAHLGPLDEELASYGMGDFVLQRDDVLTPQINWKSVLDGFMEVYHFPKLHANSIAPWFYGTHSPFDKFGIHSRLVGVRKSFDMIADKPFDEIEMMPHVAVNYQIFPNTIIVWQGDHFEVWTSYPGTEAGSCIVRVQSIISKESAVPERQSRWDRNWKIMIETVVNEDWAMSHDVQRTLPFKSNKEIIFGANEPGLQHMHGMLDAAVRAET